MTMLSHNLFVWLDETSLFFTCVNKRLIIFLIFLFFKSCIFSKSSKTLFIKSYLQKIYLQILYFELLGIEKNMYTYSFKNYLQKSVYNWLITMTLYTHVLLWFIILRSTIVCRAILSLGRTSMDGDDITTSEKNIKNEGLASVKKWKFSFRKTEIIQMSSFSLVYTPKNQYDLQSYSYCPFSIAKLMWCWLWWFVGSLLKTWHWSVWGGGSG